MDPSSGADEVGWAKLIACSEGREQQEPAVRDDLNSPASPVAWSDLEAASRHSVTIMKDSKLRAFLYQPYSGNAQGSGKPIVCSCILLRAVEAGLRISFGGWG